MRWGKRTERAVGDFKQAAEATAEAAEAGARKAGEKAGGYALMGLDTARDSLRWAGDHLPDSYRETRALGAASVGALAIGAVAFGAIAIGAFAIGRLSVGQARVRDAEIGRLRVGRLEIDSLGMPAALQRLTARVF